MARGCVDQHINGRRVCHLLDVRARREHACATGDDHCPDDRIGLMPLQRFDELEHERLRQRIELFGPIERDNANRSIDLEMT